MKRGTCQSARRGHVIHRNELFQACECALSHIRISHVTHVE